MFEKVSVSLDCLTVSSEELCAENDDNVDSKDGKERNNAAPVPKLSELRNVMKSICTYLDALSNVIDFHNFLLIHSESFATREKGVNHLVPGPDYMMDASKLLNQAPRVSDRCVWLCLDGKQHLFCWLIIAVSDQSLASNGPVVDSRDLNLVFGPTVATSNK
ncbi:hypothetical protein TNCV_2578531 [Trichonephila clavipes]|nr:hypothetical protein TNCV_2578531 [Trichonephila clavipes]